MPGHPDGQRFPLIDAAALGTHRPKAVIYSTMLGSPLDPKLVGLFGSDLLSSFGVITIDYEGAKLTLGS